MVTSMGLGASGSSGLMGHGMSEGRDSPGFRKMEQATTSKPTTMNMGVAGGPPAFDEVFDEAFGEVDLIYNPHRACRDEVHNTYVRMTAGGAT